MSLEEGDTEIIQTPLTIGTPDLITKKIRGGKVVGKSKWWALAGVVRDEGEGKINALLEKKVEMGPQRIERQAFKTVPLNELFDENPHLTRPTEKEVEGLIRKTEKLRKTDTKV